VAVGIDTMLLKSSATELLRRYRTDAPSTPGSPGY